MKKLICEQCGSNAFKQKGSYLVCSFCGTIFSMPDSSGSSDIALESDVDRLLKKCKEDPRNAKKYANLILDIDPTNSEALKYLR